MPKLYQVSNIRWDTDGGAVDLFTDIKVQVPTNEPEPDEYISDWLSEITGFCHYGFEYACVSY